MIMMQKIALGKVKKTVITFGFGDHGMCFCKEDVTLVGPASQAIAYGVKVGWKIIEVDGSECPPDQVTGALLLGKIFRWKMYNVL